MTRFNANKKGIIQLLLPLFFFLPFCLLMVDSKIVEKPFVILLLFLPCSLLSWVYFGTHYIIKEDTLLYSSAFFRGKVDIHSIREIVQGETAWTGIRPATAGKGLRIKYNTYDEIYISPQNNDALIAALKQINSGIRVVG